ncbi:MAG: hypothetical protein AUI36_08200 [Cyanobacteria bacterium 13_1_40CM_2_61_4]|nr:MAG: hypothetical protein AUI36_08200 [Cyanobacteria bacterium 13_1_40CM_2_61_4]
MDRRDWLVASAAVTGSAFTTHFQQPKYYRDLRPRRSGVAIVRADQYSDKLDELMLNGLRLFNMNVRGRSVLLKPNIVEYIPGKPVNTNTQLIGAAAEGFLRLGAGSVTVAEGPGHHRDTELLVYETGLADQLVHRKIQFVDLNRDELIKTKLRASYSGLGHLWLPRTVLASDFIVSMPKVKTHHWTGVTLSMKNMFGIVPGSRYGWPKNVLHWAGIHESILDICATVRPHFVIADGIVGMEGDGPLNGSPKRLGTILLADDPVAADSSMIRLMGLDPTRVPHVQEASRFIGNCDEAAIWQLA